MGILCRLQRLPSCACGANAFYTASIICYILKEHGCVSILNNLGIFLEGVDSKVKEVAFIVEEDGSGCFLVVAAIARVEYLYADFSVLIGMPGGNCISE